MIIWAGGGYWQSYLISRAPYRLIIDNAFLVTGPAIGGLLPKRRILLRTSSQSPRYLLSQVP
ncbi:hypothetical protein TMatcc_001674 [Talaromyces marneffei ATCC 18224]